MSSNRYQVSKNTLIYTSYSSKLTAMPVFLDDIDAYQSEFPELKKLKISILNDTLHFSCDIEDLRTFIETSEDIRTISRAGKEGHVVSLELPIFKKTFNKIQDADKWLKQRSAIIEADGGPWTYEKRLSWKNKFAAPVKKTVGE